MKNTDSKPCDNHPDRPATVRYGNDAVGGDGMLFFKVKHRFCDECDKEFKSRVGQMFIERT